MTSGLRALAVLLTLLCACQSLPDLKPGTCGNGVIEAGENCDGPGLGAAKCRQPGAADACHLDCSPKDDGTRAACPDDWGCDVAPGVCRKPTGTYSQRGEPIPGNAHTLLAADFDGDKRDDVLSQQPISSRGLTTFRVHFLARDGSLTSTWSSPARLVSLALADLTRDGRSDVVFTDGRIGMLLGQSDRTLISETYPSYFIPGAKARLLVPLYTSGIGGTAPLLVLIERDGLLSVAHPDASTGLLEQYGDSVAGTLDGFAGEPALGHIFSDPLRYPCDDVALAARGETDFVVFSVCERSQTSDEPNWRPTPGVQRVTLDPPAPIEHGPLIADVDGNGHLDVLIGAADRLYVAFGDGQQLTAAVPWLATRIDSPTGPSVLPGLPLAAGDLNGDGAADFVYPSDFALSQRDTDSSEISYRTYNIRLGTAWTSARIADLNGNGLADVVAAADDRIDIDFFNGTATNRLNPLVLPTKRPVSQLAIGDYDGDLILDVAYTQRGIADQPDEVAIAFGSAAGPPAVQTTTAHVTGLKQIGSLPFSGADVLGELFLLFDQVDETGTSGSGVAWFATAGDRSLRCWVELSTFASDRSIQSVPGVAIAAGHFSAPDRLDELLLGSLPGGENRGFWLLPDLRTGRARPESLGYPLDERLATLKGLSDELSVQASLKLVAADLDGDQLDELVFAAPDQAGEHCYIVTARVAVDPSNPDSHTLQVHEPLELERPCADPLQLTLADLDRDGSLDAVLTVLDEAGRRQLQVLWNDGHGGYSSAASSSPVVEGRIEAFAPMRAGALAYVTEDSLHLLAADPKAAGGGRTLLDRKLTVALEHATGVVAADIDGDGVQDLVVADSGNLRVLGADLEPLTGRVP